VAHHLLVLDVMPIHTSYGSYPTTETETETSAHPKAEKAKAIARRGGGFARSHWKAIGLALLGIVAWRSKRLRPLVKTAIASYVAPAAKNMFSHAAPVAKNAFARARAIRA
jgi:hypothetical protein